MKTIVPICSSTIVNEETKEWAPKSFDDFSKNWAELKVRLMGIITCWCLAGIAEESGCWIRHL